MLNRRLWILFFAFFAGFVALAVRLAKLQMSGAQEARTRIDQYLHPQQVIETYRGTIYDRFGPQGRDGQPRILAHDVPSDELAIDYRAISLDDAWLTRKAADYLRARGEWAKFKSRAERNRRLDQVKADLAAKVDAIPDFVAAQLAPLDKISVIDEKEIILKRYFEITERIKVMRQDVWINKYNRDAAAQGPSADPNADASDATLDAMFRQIQLKDEVSAHTLRANLPKQLALYFKSADLPGLVVRDMAQYNRRDYPFGAATAHLVGTLRSIDADTLRAHPFDEPNLLAENDPGDLTGYLPGDRIGETGVEKLTETLLHGTRGERLLDLTAATAPGAATAGASLGRRIDPAPGHDVLLTIDAAMQQDIYNAMQDPAQSLSNAVLHSDRNLLEGDIDGKPDGKIHFAALLVLRIDPGKPDDGQILSAISVPSYDPNTYDTTKLALLHDTWRTPLMNRAIRGIYPPGSTVKPLEASAGLTEHVITPAEQIVCRGHFLPNRLDVFRCDDINGHGPISLVDAISKSCNVYFYTVGQRLGFERLVTWYGNYGFGRNTGIELPEEIGKLPQPDRVDPEINGYAAIQMGIGQGPIAVTPLQLANAYATLLRGGSAVAPRILMRTPPAAPVQAVRFSAQDLAIIRQGMEGCTSTGTAKTNFSKMHLRVAGKTGTAENERYVFDDMGNPVDDPTKPLLKADRTPVLKPDGTPAFRQLREAHDDAWFVGYAPADHPQYVVAAIMEWGGHGGGAAAPMVREAFLQLESHGYLPRLDLP